MKDIRISICPIDIWMNIFITRFVQVLVLES